ncbi:MAG: flagellar hook-basal body protein [Peptococcales bacterium]|jgi:flagellar basal-body rod protein FlgF
MLRGLYTATSGLSAIMLRNDIETNNLTNSKTIGYKKEEVIFQSFQSHLRLDRVDYDQPTSGRAPIGKLGRGVMIGDVITYTNAQGQLTHTGKKTDFAVKGNGYFVVQNTQEGRNNYTRNGSFSFDHNSQLVTDEGFPVLGQSGPLKITGELLEIKEDGQVFVDGEYIDTLLLVDLVNPRKVGNTFFASDSPPIEANGNIVQGYLEQSNADPIEGMTNYLKNLRAYEANQKVVQAYDSTLEKVINEAGRV